VLVFGMVSYLEKGHNFFSVDVPLIEAAAVCRGCLVRNKLRRPCTHKDWRCCLPKKDVMQYPIMNIWYRG
jgi:hypothetical protein